jgi:hypothetical protein
MDWVYFIYLPTWFIRTTGEADLGLSYVQPLNTASVVQSRLMIGISLKYYAYAFYHSQGDGFWHFFECGESCKHTVEMLHWPLRQMQICRRRRGLIVSVGS